MPLRSSVHTLFALFYLHYCLGSPSNHEQLKAHFCCIKLHLCVIICGSKALTAALLAKGVLAVQVA